MKNAGLCTISILYGVPSLCAVVDVSYSLGASCYNPESALANVCPCVRGCVRLRVIAFGFACGCVWLRLVARVVACGCV